MKISCLMTTYGRVAHLQFALQDFLCQTHPDRELIIVNSCTDQTLEFEHPLVKVVNLSQRPPSLGACRNIAVEIATGDVIVTWDDDDKYLPEHLAHFAFTFSDPDVRPDWVWMENQWYSEKGKIVKRMSGSYNTFAFKKSAWETAGKYNELSVGEDKHFVSRVTSLCEGTKITLPDDQTTFIYCWGNNAYHISGHGVDTGALKPAYERVADDLKRRFDIGIEPKGRIQLVPADVQDLKLLVREFIDAENQKNDQKLPVAIVMGGRYGDIASIFPICLKIAEEYAKPHLVVAREFASILDGVSYVIPEIVDCNYNRLETLMSHARRRFPIVLRGQIYGIHHEQQKRTVSYVTEAWLELGFLCRYTDPNFRLIFDKRDRRREEQLVTKLKTDKPMLLVNLKSISSPFPFGAELLGLIRSRLSNDFNIVDLTGIQCERIYDLIGLFDASAGIITADTSTVHLAAASDVKVILLRNPLPWAGTFPRCNWIKNLTYNEAQSDPESIINCIKDSMLTQ